MHLYAIEASLSENASQAASAGVNPIVGTLVMVAGFTAMVVIFAAFLTIVRKNKNPMK